MLKEMGKTVNLTYTNQSPGAYVSLTPDEHATKQIHGDTYPPCFFGHI